MSVRRGKHSAILDHEPDRKSRDAAPFRVTLGALSVALALVGVVPAAARGAVAAFPTPGDRVASTLTQIAFRGLPYSQLRRARIVVTGSKTGRHQGRLSEDSDGRGGSFLPSEPFAAGEAVRVTTSMSIQAAKRGSFQFTVANPAGSIPYGPLAHVHRVPGDVWTFHSEPGLQPTAVRVSKPSAPTAPGDIFLAPQSGPVQYGPEIIDPNGNLVWSTPAPPNDEVTNFQVQTYEGQKVLTWWHGNVNGGCGRGDDVIYNSSYQQIAEVGAANGQQADLHEFEITPSNTAIITACYPVYWNATSVHGLTKQVVLDDVVQEIDPKTGLLLFEWNTLDHVPVTNSYQKLPPRKSRVPFDYLHVNSVDLDRDGNLLISGRNTRAVYKVNHQTGATIWVLGGKQSSFKIAPGATFAFQHDVRVVSTHDWFVTVFDNGSGPPLVHRSRGLKLFLDTAHRRAWEVSQYMISPPQQTYVEGSYQQLPDTHTFIGWGSAPYFSEYTAAGKQIFSGRFVDQNESYRTFRFPWSGTPTQPPAVAASTSGGHTKVYVSWNGATAVASWRVLGGSSPNGLAAVATAAKGGFETEITTRSAQKYVAVQALDAHGKVLGQCAPAQPN
jgi:hypothetical protein